MEAPFIYLLKSSLILLLFALSYYVLLRKETFFGSNRFFLLAGVFIAFTLPFFTIERIILIEPSAIVLNELYPAENLAATAKVAPWRQWMNIVFLVYILGVLYFSFRLLQQLKAIAKIVVTSDIVIEQGLYHVRTKKNIAPFSFFRHIFYCPYQFKAAELKTIITHEKVHARDWHSLDILIAELLFILLWFNPIVWIYQVLIKQNLEFLADAKACTIDTNKKKYQYLMLQQAVSKRQLSIVNPFYNSIIKKRIVMLNQNRSKSINHLKALVIIPFLVLFLYGFNTKDVIQYHEVSQKHLEYETKESLPRGIEEKSGFGTNKNVLNGNQNTAKNKIAVENSSNSVLRENAEHTSKQHTARGTNANSIPTKDIRASTTIELSINKNTSEESLNKIKQELAEKGIDFSYTTVRNNLTEIIDISIQISGKNNDGEAFNGNYRTNSDNAIKPITIRYNEENNAISFWNAESPTIRTNGKNNKQGKDGVDSEEADSEYIAVKKVNGKKIVSTNSEDVDEYEMNFNIKEKESNESAHGENVLILKNSDKDDYEIKIKSKNIKFENENKKDEPLIYIDGKISNRKKVKRLSPKKIKSVNILKGKSAIKKYGKKGKNGVVEIITQDAEE